MGAFAPGGEVDGVLACGEAAIDLESERFLDMLCE
jgi:hypothetical protein